MEEDLWRSVVAKLIARPAKGIDMARLRAELATHRQRLDEVAADYDVHSLLHISEHGGDRQYFYLARARSWSAEAGDRSGPEFTDPSRGEYHLQPIPFTAQALGGSTSNQKLSPGSSSATCATVPTCSLFPTSAPAKPPGSEPGDLRRAGFSSGRPACPAPEPLSGSGTNRSAIGSKCPALASSAACAPRGPIAPACEASAGLRYSPYRSSPI